MTRHPIVLACSLILLLAASTLHAGWDDGVAAFSAGRYDEAVAAFQSFVDSRPEAAAGHYMLGQTLLRQMRFADALAPLGEAVALGPGETRYTLALAQAQLKAGKADDALGTLGAAQPDSVPDALRHAFNQLLAGAAASSDRETVALDGLEKALAADPGDRHLLLAVAQVSGRLDQPERAFTALAAAYELDPSDAEVGQRAVRKAMDVAHDEDLDEGRKIDWYRRGAVIAGDLVAASPTPENLLLAGEAEMGAKQYRAAVARFDQALAIRADDRRLRYNLGRCHLALGDSEEALEHLQAALAREGDGLVTEIHAARASALRNLERFDEAAVAFRQAGDADQAAEMERYAENRREWAAAKADCVEKRDRISKLLEGGDGLEDAPEWKELEREAAAILAACEPYLNDKG